MYLGICIWTMMRNPPYQDTVKKIGDIGFRGVELIAWSREAVSDYYTAPTCRELRGIIADKGMTLTNFNHNSLAMTSEDPQARLYARETFRRVIEAAHALGSKSVTTTTPYPFGLMPDNFPKVVDIPQMPMLEVRADIRRDWNANWNLFVDEMGVYCQMAAQAGLRMLVEAHPHRWIYSTDSLLRLVENVKADNLGFNFDPSHLFHCGELPQCSIYRAGKAIGHVHISDNDTYTNAHWQPGQGKMDWKAMLQAFSDIGYDGALSIELENVPGCAGRDRLMTDEMYGQLALSAKFMRTLGKEMGIPVE